eukprot:gnl/MRDRNA2_/MRDRNA2_95259_c0_seq1.p1 gnl/MRDRNA2_/MRDRNA2_95259_c0~~gnl/MRDRNA2_/MRDRNA2_95259_c0_seq1.p1  ORF type:complete len:422 (-),score=95.16 gnl/MRDRNA2_/MRDRNA2_95259_c0_seq1:65-1330(-)
MRRFIPSLNVRSTLILCLFAALFRQASCQEEGKSEEKVVGNANLTVPDTWDEANKYYNGKLANKAKSWALWADRQKKCNLGTNQPRGAWRLLGRKKEKYMVKASMKKNMIEAAQGMETYSRAIADGVAKKYQEGAVDLWIAAAMAWKTAQENVDFIMLRMGQDTTGITMGKAVKATLAATVELKLDPKGEKVDAPKLWEKAFQAWKNLWSEQAARLKQEVANKVNISRMRKRARRAAKRKYQANKLFNSPEAIANRTAVKDKKERDWKEGKGKVMWTNIVKKAEAKKKWFTEDNAKRHEEAVARKTKEKEVRAGKHAELLAQQQVEKAKRKEKLKAKKERKVKDSLPIWKSGWTEADLVKRHGPEAAKPMVAPPALFSKISMGVSSTTLICFFSGIGVTLTLLRGYRVKALPLHAEGLLAN